MSIETMAVVLHHSQAKATDKLILLGIANHDGDNGAYPGIPTLARYANVTEKSAREAVRRLEKLGELETHLNAGPVREGGRTNRYDVLVACPPACDRTTRHRLAAPVDNGDSTPPTPTGAPTPTGGTSPTPTGDTPPTPALGEPSLEPSINHPLPQAAPIVPAAVADLWEGEGISEDERQALWEQLVNDPETVIPARRAIQAAWYVPAVAAIRAKSSDDRASALEQLRKYGPDCEHDVPGGAALHPTTGLPLCPLCRSASTRP